MLITPAMAPRARPNGFSASPVGVDGKVFLHQRRGETFVLKAGKTFELLHVKKMNEKVTTDNHGRPLVLHSREAP